MFGYDYQAVLTGIFGSLPGYVVGAGGLIHQQNTGVLGTGTGQTTQAQAAKDPLQIQGLWFHNSRVAGTLGFANSPIGA